MALIQKTTVKRILAACAAIFVVASSLWLATHSFHERQAANLRDARVEEIIAMLDLKRVANFHQRLDKIRTFINDNSDHEIDDAFFANHGNAAAFGRRRHRSCQGSVRAGSHGVQHSQYA
jgi:hypothetical protein